MGKKGEEKSKDDDSLGDQPMEEKKGDDGKEEDAMSSLATNLNKGGTSPTQGYVDPKKYNKFKNDGSFLAQVLALQKKKKVRKIKEAEGTDGKKKKKSRKTSSQQGDDEEDAEAEHDGKEKDEEDEREVAIKNEYIEKINKMKEEGLFTDKGIGAGMVK